MITILVRTSNRPALFKRMFESVISQVYKDWQMIISYDQFSTNDYLINYLPNYYGRLKAIPVNPDKSKPYYWNLYCNDLKEEVKDGWFFYLDDDDYLYSPNSLRKISEHLTEDKGLICQFFRNRKTKPNHMLIATKQIKIGHIGGSCLFLHAKHKSLADWDGEKAADFRWINGVSEKIEMDFVAIPVVVAGNNGLHGKI